MEHYWTLLLGLIGVVTISEAVVLQCYKSDDLSDYDSASLETPETLIDSSCINLDKETFIFSFGFTGTSNGTAATSILSAVNQDVWNVILVNWEKEARGAFLPTLAYTLKSVETVQRIGKQLGKALYALHNADLDLDSVYMVGHSLGAQLMANTGRELSKHGLKVARITGLDPAGPMYEGVLPIFSPLGKDCADFVDIIHTDPGHFGVDKSTGTVDIWFNYGYYEQNKAQPGCEPDNNPQTDMHQCNHCRAWEFFSEALSDPTKYVAGKASSYEDWESQKGDCDDLLHLGFDTDTEATGDYYLTTDNSSPYGLGPAGLKPPKIIKTTKKKKLLGGLSG